jgi:hypothetical protein
MSTTIAWNVKGTSVKGNGMLICDAAAVSAATSKTDVTRISSVSCAVSGSAMRRSTRARLELCRTIMASGS